MSRWKNVLLRWPYVRDSVRQKLPVNWILTIRLSNFTLILPAKKSTYLTILCWTTDTRFKYPVGRSNYYSNPSETFFVSENWRKKYKTRQRLKSTVLVIHDRVSVPVITRRLHVLVGLALPNWKRHSRQIIINQKENEKNQHSFTHELGRWIILFYFKHTCYMWNSPGTIWKGKEENRFGAIRSNTFSLILKRHALDQSK
jgi:hypothetical protein